MNYRDKLLATPLLIALIMTLAACGGSSSSRSAPVDDGVVDETPDETPDEAAEPVVRIVLLGDSGSGSAGAYAVGEAVAKVCAAKGCDLVLGLGDNIYESGVSSELDPQFEEKFELPFAPIDLPFYMVLGNHDNSGFFGGDGANNSNGDFQVDYHYRDTLHPEQPRQTSRWKMPARYYRFTQGGDASAPLVELFGVDSNQIAGGFPDSDENYSYNNYGLVQAQWLKAAMASSKAKWRIAFAHHPYLSNGSHGNAGNYDGIPGFIAPVLAGSRYKSFLEETLCDKADFFSLATTTIYSGYCLSHLAEKPALLSLVRPVKPEAWKTVTTMPFTMKRAIATVSFGSRLRATKWSVKSTRLTPTTRPSAWVR